MKKLLTIAKDASIKVNSNVTDFLLPSEVFLPINKNAKMLITKKNIKKGDALFSLDKKIVYSPVSGKVINIVTREDNKLYLKIKNDFKENDNYEGVTEFTTVTIKTDFPKRIKEYTNYDWKKFKNKKTIIFNGIEDEPYVANKPFLHKIYRSEILQMLDLLSEAFKIEKINLYFKENDRESIESFDSLMGTYPNMMISILPDLYPIGKEEIFTSFLKLEEDSVIVYSEEIYDLYREIVKERRKDSFYFTLTGDAIKNPQVVNVKIGTPLKDVIDEIAKLKKVNYEVYLNGLMNGTKINIDDIILTPDVRVIYLMKERKEKVEECIRCGKCIEVCPLNCNPYRSYETNGKFKNKGCIQCGLCTFICPSYIHLNDYLGGEHHE